MENSSSSDNLDDGELWLPSDIFPVEEPVAATNKLKNNNPIITSSICYCYSCLLLHRHHNEQQEEAAISLLQHHSTHSFPKPFPITEVFLQRGFPFSIESRVLVYVSACVFAVLFFSSIFAIVAVIQSLLLFFTLLFRSC